MMAKWYFAGSGCEHTFIVEICYLSLEKWTLSYDIVNSNSSCALDSQSKFARASTVDADNLGSDTEMEQVIPLGRARIDLFDLRRVDFFSG